MPKRNFFLCYEKGRKKKTFIQYFCFRTKVDYVPINCALRVTQPLRLVGQEPEPSQATDKALACCFLDKVLGVGCHYFSPPLDIPSFSARYLHVCTTREILVAKGGTMGENIVR